MFLYFLQNFKLIWFYTTNQKFRKSSYFPWSILEYLSLPGIYKSENLGNLKFFMIKHLQPFNIDDVR